MLTFKITINPIEGTVELQAASVTDMQAFMAIDAAQSKAIYTAIMNEMKTRINIIDDWLIKNNNIQNEKENENS